MSAFRDGKSNKKKVLVLANFHVGLYRFRKELLKQLLQAGYDVTIALPDGELVRPLEELGCRFVDTPMERRGIDPRHDLKLLGQYIALLRRERPDMVVTYTIKPNIYGGLACRLLGVPHGANITGLGTAFQREGLLKKLVTGLYRSALKRSRVVFFENQANLELFQELKLCRPERCRRLNGAGVDLDYFAPQPYPAEMTPTRFLFIGRVMREKGMDELLTAMARLRAEGENCLLDVLGEFEEDYREAFRRGQEAGWLHYHGQQSDVRPFIEQAHCFVLPSWHEGMANTNLECAASGRPVITSDIPGCREAVVAGTSGLLCQAQNADSLYQAMKSFLTLSREESCSMGRAGRGHMEAKFDKKAVVAETMRGLGL